MHPVADPVSRQRRVESDDNDSRCPTIHSLACSWKKHRGRGQSSASAPARRASRDHRTAPRVTRYHRRPAGWYQPALRRAAPPTPRILSSARPERRPAPDALGSARRPVAKPRTSARSHRARNVAKLAALGGAPPSRTRTGFQVTLLDYSVMPPVPLDGSAVTVNRATLSPRARPRRTVRRSRTLRPARSVPAWPPARIRRRSPPRR